MLSNIAYRQKPCKIISLTVYNHKHIDKLIGKNLKRLRTQRKLTQTKLGDLIEVDGNVISQLEGAIIGMGKDIMARLCNALKVEPADFYISEKTPLPSSDLERKALYIAREAEKMGVRYIAEEAVEYTTHRLQVVKKQEGKGAGKSKATRLKAGNG
ncbi:MAG: hypothetical protein A2X55_03155 [Nitrospirae bacterium GWB2_47_37]|nr:MAG: hypothetical protein A2Z82_01110 [Nitrospirae bacterium GWA2_46_11]OGW25472.1 MAG: hypothetical protein A2X55_03155 [Nitrospirae bacterium GWB2_47_37]